MRSDSSHRNEISRSNSIFNVKDKLRQENSIDSNESIQKNKEKSKKREKKREKEFIKEKETEINKLIKNIISVNLSELQEAIHKENLQFQHLVNESIQNYSQKLKNFSTFEKRLIDQLAELKLKTEKTEQNTNKINTIDDKLTSYDIKLSNLLKEFHSACIKYDEIFIDNMTLPGKIGNFCKYKNVREFLSEAFNKFNEFDLKKESDATKLKNNQDKIDKFIKKMNIEMNVLRDEIMEIGNKKFGFLEKKFTKEIIEIKNTLDNVPNRIIISELEKKINDLMDNYINLKKMKEEIYFRINNLEIEIENLRDTTNKSPKIKNSSFKKDLKVTFSNLSGAKYNHLKKNQEGDSTFKNKKKTSNSSKNVNKYYSLNVNKSPLYKDNSNNDKNEHIIDLNYITEEFDENNDNTPINNMRIKSINFKLKTKNSNNNNENNKSMDINNKIINEII